MSNENLMGFVNGLRKVHVGDDKILDILSEIGFDKNFVRQVILEEYNRLYRIGKNNVDILNITVTRNIITIKNTISQPNNIFSSSVEQGKIIVKNTQSGEIVKSGMFNYIIDKNGILKVGEGDYVLANQQNVLGAGSFLIDNGRVTHISNLSGHYQPTIAEAYQSYKSLEAEGINMNNVKDYTIDFGGEDFIQNMQSDQLTEDWLKVLEGLGLPNGWR